MNRCSLTLAATLLAVGCGADARFATPAALEGMGTSAYGGSSHGDAVGDDGDVAPEFAARYAPVLYFDSQVPGGRGPHAKCLPGSAEGYYLARKGGDHGRICNQDRSSLESAPAYYEASRVASSVFVTYWFFYGYQSTCFANAGGHDSDWERVTVRIEDARVRDVVYYQHDGHYTRTADTIRMEGHHPVAFVGKNSHGSYHDAGGVGGCGYFDDYRNPGARNLRWETWRAIVSIRAGGETWMRAGGEDDALWQGPTPPTRRGASIDGTVCRETAGAFAIGGLRITSTNTCARSDYKDEGMPLRELAAPPWRLADCASPSSSTCHGPRACFYAETDYRGPPVCYPPGERGWVGPGYNDVYSSVRLFEGAVVAMFRDTAFGGERRAVQADTANFKDIGFNDALSSLRVQRP